MDIPALRQHNQGIGSSFASVADAVRGLGAIQAQDYPAALWAVALRCDGVTEVDVEDAIARGEIVRTWPMRGTYHFVAAEDARWMVGLLGPRVLAGVARRHRQLELEEADFKRSEDVCRRELTGGRRLTRPSFYRLLQSDGVSTAGQRGIHIVQYLALTGLICYGPREGSQPTLVLLDEWTPASKALDREEALAAIALRYFAGHGPATLRDFGWWTGLAANEARDAIALAGPALLDASIDGLRYWLTGERIATM
ncbi:MAG TPA: winged helix DNA-binding domain-containing protein, partial [Dehalococcoidia bacterium]